MILQNKYKLLIFCVIFYGISLWPVNSFAQTVPIDNGLFYLRAIQSVDGSWGSDADLTVLDTSTVLDTLKLLNISDGAYSNGVARLSSQSSSSTDFLSRKIVSLSLSGVDVSADVTTLVNSKNRDGGWGEDTDSSSSPLDTTLSLLALHSINHPDQTIITSALAYLLTTQNADGGFGFYAGDVSNLYMTALVSATVQQFSQTTAIASALNKATSYLVAHQNADGGFGISPSTAYETAHAYIALVSVTTDNTVLGNAITYLTSTQLQNGSWNDDPYSTALALRALFFSENKPPPPPVPTTGTVTGTVVDAATNQPLGGATITVVNSQLSATTTSTGAFTLSNIPAGSQPIEVSLSGYSTVAATVDMIAGAIINLGTVSLFVSSTTAIIQGVVTDAQTGSPLSDALVTVTGATTLTANTAADGSYKISNILPQTVTISVEKGGYFTVSASATVTAGGLLIFSPALSTRPPTATTGDLKGTVLDGVTNQPITGATVAATLS